MLDVAIPPGYELCSMPDGGFAKMTGPLFIKQTKTGPRFALRAEAKHVNGRDVVHGGMLMTLADQVLGLTVQRHIGTINVATVSLHCDLVTSARPGDLIEGMATISRSDRTLIFVKGTLFCGEKTIMNASGVWARLSRPQTLEEA